jgi:hypothetical protein
VNENHRLARADIVERNPEIAHLDFTHWSARSLVLIQIIEPSTGAEFSSTTSMGGEG